MWNWLTSAGTFLVESAALVFPFFKGKWRVPAWIFWTLHALVIALVLVGLYYLNNHDWVRMDVRIPTPRFAKRIWLPLFFLLLYAAGWLIWWIVREIYGDGVGEGSFPEIDKAWAEARAALDREGIRLTEVPLFLVLGRPEAPEDQLFQAAQLSLNVRQTPAGPAPLHVYASRDSIFVTCAGASLLGKQAANIALEGLLDQDGGSSVMYDAHDDEGSIEVTMMPLGKKEREVKKIVLPGRNGPIRTLEKRLVRRAMNLKGPRSMAEEEKDRLSACLAHLCRVIARDRRPECALNGILLLVPLGATDTKQEAQDTAQFLRRDLLTVRSVTKLLCPMVGLVCDLESFPGFRDFVRRCDKESSRRQKSKTARIGLRFHPSSALEGKGELDVLAQAVQFYCVAGLRGLVYPMFVIEEPGSEAPAEADVKPASDVGQDGSSMNRNMYLMLDEMRQRKENLATLLTEAFKPLTGPLLFGGCYFAATGAEEQEQAFVGAVVKKLVGYQSNVAWSDEGLAEDRGLRRWAQLGYLAIGTLVLAAVASVAYLLWQRR